MKLPFLISIPHGGTVIPFEIRDKVGLSKHDLFNDSDAFTREIYDVEDMVAFQIKANIARAFVDLNRPTDALPPEFPDGVVKSLTCYNKPVYNNSSVLSKEETQVLLKKYYQPYHKKIQKALENPEIILGLDCHSMATVAPNIAPDTGQQRPLINLGNVDGQAASNEVTSILKSCFVKIFELPEHEVIINWPFKGGHITRTYGNKPKPWIQIEINRNLYLNAPWFELESLQINRDRIQELNRKFRQVLRQFANQIARK
ncbi:MAG: N-formylglutamate amidohydrolase [Calditrichaeota bacterium]|nr:MAG: N-formylglutamate amidohydrolase [Calditrichota bacterium]